MADTSEKTEQPTSRRLNKARDSGNVPTSMELLSAISLIVLTATTFFMGPKVIDWASAGMRDAFSCQTSFLADPQVFHQYLVEKGLATAVLMAPFFLALAVAGTAGSVAVSGFRFSTKKLKLKFDFFNPSKGLKQLFSLSAMVKLGLSVVKLTFIGIIVYIYLRKRIGLLATFQWTWDMGLLSSISHLILGVLIRLCIGLLIVGLIDLLYQKWQHIKNLKMSKQEVKDERRNMEGPPEVQRHIRRKQFELAMQRMLQEVPKANVVLVNPTHVAVALKYDPKTMNAPVVVAKGPDHVCEKIKEVARAYGIPIIRRPALARNLFANVKLGHPIPESLFVAVAEIMALIHRLRRSR